jgi:hypothetical protein
VSAARTLDEAPLPGPITHDEYRDFLDDLRELDRGPSLPVAILSFLVCGALASPVVAYFWWAVPQLRG